MSTLTIADGERADAVRGLAIASEQRRRDPRVAAVSGEPLHDESA